MLNFAAPILDARSLSTELPNINSGASFSIASHIFPESEANKTSGERVFLKFNSFLTESLYSFGILSDIAARDGIHPNSFTKNLLMAIA